MSIASFSIKRRVTVFMAVLGVIVFGIFSLNRLELKLLPEITYPTLTVRTELTGGPPEEVEELISRPIEEVLSIISNLEEITSVSRAGMSDVILEFHWNTSMDKALMDVREKLDTVILPDSAERPRILRYNPETEPVLKLSITGDDLVKMQLLAENEVKPRLETLDGIAAAKITGGDKEEIRIDIDTRRLSTLGLTLQSISNQLQQENINMPGGMLEEGNTQFLVRTINEFKTEMDIGNIVIGRRDNVDVRLRDVANIFRANVEKQTITHLNGRESVLIDIYKEGDANIIAVADSVYANLGSGDTIQESRTHSIRSLLPDDFEIEIISDQSVFIRSAINEVKSAAIFGCILAVLVLYIFMRNLPSTLIIGISIPISIIATFTLMYFKGISLNLMSLGGLALGIGMLVDNSIVVLENIFRLREKGLPLQDASQQGTEQVTTAVIASTLTTIAVFFPIVFVKGIAGQIFNDLAWTIAFSLLASLIVSLSLIPMVSSLSRGSTSTEFKPLPILDIWQKNWKDKNRSPLKRITNGLFEIVSKAFKQLYTDLITQIRPSLKTINIQNKSLAVGLAILIFPARFSLCILSFVLITFSHILVNGSWLFVLIPVTMGSLAWQLIKFVISPFLALFNKCYTSLQIAYPKLLRSSLNHPSRAPVLSLLILLLVSFSVIPKLGMDLIPVMSQGEFLIDIKLPIGSPLEETRHRVQMAESLVSSRDEVKVVSALIGSDATASSALGAEQEHMATIQVVLKEHFRDKRTEQRIIASLRDQLQQISGIVKLEFRRPALFTLKTPLEIEVRGNNLDDIMEISGLLVEQLDKEPEFKDVFSTMESGYPEIQVEFDRIKLARLGMSPNDAASVLRNAIQGNVSTEFGNIGEEIDIRVQADEKNNLTTKNLNHLVISPETSAPIYLNSVASVTKTIGPSEIRRIDQRRVALVRADTPMLDLRRAKQKAHHVIDSLPKRQGVFFAVTGQTQEMEESSGSLLVALLMAIFLVYLVMASQFESLIQPLIILFSIPLALIGVLMGLYLMNISISAVVFIGLIVLAGIVVNNAIVLVDTTNQFYRSGEILKDAVIKAADRRLRPIAMTAMTTVLGLFPMAIATGAGQEIRQPLAVTVILGLVVSTFLTLIVIPSIYYMIHRRLNLSGDTTTTGS